MTPNIETFQIEIVRSGERDKASMWTLYAVDTEEGDRRQIGEPAKGFCMTEPAGAAQAFESIVAEIANKAIGERLSS